MAGTLLSQQRCTWPWPDSWGDTMVLNNSVSCAGGWEWPSLLNDHLQWKFQGTSFSELCKSCQLRISSETFWLEFLKPPFTCWHKHRKVQSSLFSQELENREVLKRTRFYLGHKSVALAASQRDQLSVNISTPFWVKIPKYVHFKALDDFLQLYCQLLVSVWRFYGFITLYEVFCFLRIPIWCCFVHNMTKKSSTLPLQLSSQICKVRSNTLA